VHRLSQAPGFRRRAKSLTLLPPRQDGGSLKLPSTGPGSHLSDEAALGCEPVALDRDATGAVGHR
jgi:hypothetical protein